MTQYATLKIRNGRYSVYYPKAKREVPCKDYRDASKRLDRANNKKEKAK